MKAVIPVAGEGTRLRPHTHTTPKPLLRVAGKPILGHILDDIVELGIGEIVLIVGYRGRDIVEYVTSNYDVQVHVVLRSKADYDVSGEPMPAPRYKWIWDVSYREPTVGAEIFHVFVDGMNGDYITKETIKPSP